MNPHLQRAALPVAGGAAAVAALWLAALAYLSPSSLLLAPMLGLEPCITPASENTVDAAAAAALAPSCEGPQGSGAALVEATLAGLETPGQLRHPFELGYTLNVPLLRLFKPEGTGWAIDQALVGRFARTIRDNPRPVVLYLFSTHFSQGAPIEKALAADPANLSWTQQGPLADSIYYGAPIYNWSFATTANGITQRRVEAANAILAALCRLDWSDRRKVRAITLLGELHHLFPSFETGMGFDKPYLITDYSEASKAGFRAFLQQRYGSIGELNQALGSTWRSFSEITPPAKDIRKEPLRDYTEHLDAFAHGILPITGWTYAPDATPQRPARIRVYRNGELAGSAAIDQHRQDVLEALPELGTANTGWRFDLDFRKLPTGLHRIDVVLEPADGEMVRLATRHVAIMDKRHATPELQPQAAPPAVRAADASVRFSVDSPPDQASFFYNPMAPLWHEFRGDQVVRYLESFRAALQPSCMKGTDRFTHQIVPFTNPGWDETRFAIEASLKPLPGLGLGVSLYGEPTYGQSFARWLHRTRHARYGVTEFHPLKPLSPGETRALLHRHALDGAEFLSFFMEPRWQGRKVSRHTNLFSLDPENRQYGSDVLYGSFRAVLADPDFRVTGSPRILPYAIGPARSTP
jgi:hypothetical protein